MRTKFKFATPDGRTTEFKPNYRDIQVFSRYAIRAMKAFYADPDNMERFEKWKAERDAAKAKEA